MSYKLHKWNNQQIKQKNAFVKCGYMVAHLFWRWPTRNCCLNRGPIVLDPNHDDSYNCGLAEIRESARYQEGA